MITPSAKKNDQMVLSQTQAAPFDKLRVGDKAGQSLAFPQ